MVLKLRLTGWTVFVAGVVLLLLDQTIPGIIVGGAGILLTSLSNLIGSRAHLKRTAPPPELLTPESAEKAKDFIRKHGDRPEPPPPSSPPSEPSRPD